ncbi:3486_t:CDS:2, partial [Ambispora leptoticha]
LRTSSDLKFSSLALARKPYTSLLMNIFAGSHQCKGQQFSSSIPLSVADMGRHGSIGINPSTCGFVHHSLQERYNIWITKE